MAASSAPILIDVNKDSQTIQLASHSQDTGAAEETIGAEITGDDIKIYFSPRYFNDGLSSIQKEEVDIYLQSPESAAVFETGEDGYKYIIMPVRLQA